MKDEVFIDVEKLRYDLIDYFGTAMFNGFPMSMMELEEVKKADFNKLIEIAQKNNVNLDDYVVSVKKYFR